MEDAIDRIKDSEAASHYPSAVLGLDYVSNLRDRYDGLVYEERVHALTEEVQRAGYTRANISPYAVSDTAVAKKIDHINNPDSTLNSSK